MREQDNLTITSEMRVCVHVYKEREGERGGWRPGVQEIWPLLGLIAA